VCIRLLGEGGFGKVYEAMDLSTGQVCVVKMISQADKYTTQEELQEILKKEFVLLASLPEHPHLVTVLGGGIYYAMEKFGRPLSQYKGGDKKSPYFVPQVMTGVFKALWEYHKRGLAHLDVKPSNVLVEQVDDNFQVKLIDPNLSPQGEMFAGTPEYSSPEFCLDASGATPRSDLYSAGLLFYELLTGNRPWHWIEDHTDLITIRQISAHPRWDRDLPVGIRRLVDDLLMADSNRRPKDVMSCLKRLEPYPKIY